MSDQARLGKDPAAHRGTQKAIRTAWGAPLLVDQAADAAFASSIRRLKGEPGTNGGKK